MNVLFSFILLLSGTSDSKGLSFQTQVGYEPSVMAKGRDFKGDAALFYFAPLVYTSHGLRGKVGIQTQGGWKMGAISSGALCIIPLSRPNLSLSPDSIGNIWLNDSTRWISSEYSAGAELGRSFKRKWAVFVGLEFVWGKLSGTSHLSKNNPESTQDDIRVVHVISTIRGLQGHVGMSIPIISFGEFSLQINPLLKGGALKEKSTNIPPEAEWKGPYTLSKWGAALRLTLNDKVGGNK